MSWEQIHGEDLENHPWKLGEPEEVVFEYIVEFGLELAYSGPRCPG